MNGSRYIRTILVFFFWTGAVFLLAKGPRYFYPTKKLLVNNFSKPNLGDIRSYNLDKELTVENFKPNLDATESYNLNKEHPVENSTPNLVATRSSHAESESSRSFSSNRRLSTPVTIYPKQYDDLNQTSEIHEDRLTNSTNPKEWDDELKVAGKSQNTMDSYDTSETAVPNARQRFLLWNNAEVNIADSDSPSGVNDSRKYVIYRCDSGKMHMCGGMADRIKGMIAGYVIANVTDRTFKIDIQVPPCNLTQYLVPNFVNWILPKPFHQQLNTIPPDTTIVNFMNSQKYHDRMSTLNFTTLTQTNKFVYFKANLDYSSGFQNSSIYQSQLSWMKYLSPNQIQATLFKRLFKLSPRLQSKLQILLASELPTPEHRLICAHVRMGRNPTIPRDVLVRLTVDNLYVVWNFLRKHSTSDLHRVFLMTDSKETETEAKLQKFGKRLITMIGVIGHVDISRDLSEEEMCEATEKVIFDLHVLMNCDILLVSNSGLSRLAAYVRGTDDGLYCLRRDKKVIPCEMRRLKEIYDVMG